MATVKFRFRRDTAANWTAENPILALGEPGVETDTRKTKYGDGTTAWASLSYSAAGSIAFADITSKPTTLAGYGITDAQPLNAKLTAISGLTTAADRIIYWTSSSAAAVTPLTSFGRSLIDDVDAAAARATLDLIIATSGNGVAKLNGAATTWDSGATFGGLVQTTGASGGVNLTARDSTDNFILFAESNTLNAYANGAVRWSLTSAGIMTLGKIVLRDDTPFGTGANISAGANSLLLGNTSANFILFYVNSVLRMTIDTSGNTRPGADVTYTLGTATVRWLSGFIAALYTGIRTITATASTTTSDFTILCDATSGAITVNLPAASGMTGRILNVKKIDASANAVTVDGSGAETIDGAATKVIAAQWGVLNLQCNGTAWFLI